MSATSVTYPYYVDRTISVTATSTKASSSSPAATASASFTLRIKNPCIEKSFNSVTVPADRTISYTINDEIMTIDHTKGFSMLLATECGDLSYSFTGLTTSVK